MRSHGKITRQWKSTLTDLINREDTMVYSLRAVGRSVVRLPASWSLHRRHRRVAMTELNLVCGLIIFLFRVVCLFVFREQKENYLMLSFNDKSAAI